MVRFRGINWCYFGEHRLGRPSEETPNYAPPLQPTSITNVVQLADGVMYWTLQANQRAPPAFALVTMNVIDISESIYQGASPLDSVRPLTLLNMCKWNI